MVNEICNNNTKIEGPVMTSDFWFKEYIMPSLSTSSKLTSIMFDKQSTWQRVQVINTDPWGKMLVLDGKSQSALSDEFVYHECLVHPALTLHPNPKRIYIGGGGEFATARESLKHKSVEKVVMVDIDKEVCDICREQLPEWNDGAYEDERTEVYYEDAHAFLQNYQGDKFDVIIMDIADPIEAGPGIVMYTKEFYEYAITKLNPGGILVTQSGPGSVYNWHECCSAIHNTLEQAFDHVITYTADIPSFGSNWSFNIAFNGDPNRVKGLTERTPQVTENLIASKLGASKLRFYDGISHCGIFGLPRPVREGIAQETRVITVDNPVFMF